MGGEFTSLGFVVFFLTVLAAVVLGIVLHVKLYEHNQKEKARKQKLEKFFKR